MIDLQEVTKTYQSTSSPVVALDRVSLKIDQGEYVTIRGPSGCGKSTLLAMVGGLSVPTSGTVTVDGQTLSKQSSHERASFRHRHIGFIFQMFHLLPYLTIRDNILVAAGENATEKDRSLADQLMQDLGIEQRANHLPGQVSAGERQRAAMARAVLHHPKLLLADEPTGNLDPVHSEAVLNWIDQFHKSGGTIMLVTHDENAASRASRTIRLDAGRLQSA